MISFADLKDELASYLENKQLQEVASAYDLAALAHQHQTRYTGEPYISHPVAVAYILAKLHLDKETIMAALLHDVIEDTSIDKATITQRFNPKIAELVDGVSKLEQIKFENKEQAQAENFRKMMLAMAQDIRVILIKLADRLHNMRTLKGVPRDKQIRIAKETLEIYAPIAHRLGIHTMRIEFEELGFAALYPLRYRVFKTLNSQSQLEKKELMHTIEDEIKQKLTAGGLTQFTFLGREKHLYGLYKKMRKQHLSWHEVTDKYAFRILVNDIKECYIALGLVHLTYRPAARLFKDYIAIPKANNYQSLHTVLIGPFGIPIEIQIRTHQMQQIAENGVAAHWLYKSQGLDKSIHMQEWINDIAKLQKTTETSKEFVETLKTDLFHDDVYVFTPKGEILSLPQGATSVDLAYLIHTDIGNHCIGCSIDRRTASLSTRLQSGQTVEIQTHPTAHPHPSWLNFVITSKAKSNIESWLQSQKKSASRALGKRLLNDVLVKSNSNLEKVNHDIWTNVLKDLEINKLDDLYEEVGVGKRMAPLVAQQILEHSIESQLSQFIIQGTEGIAVSYASCCHPIPNDGIIALIEKGKGIVVHREKCEHMMNHRNNLEWLPVHWSEQIRSEFNVPINVIVLKRRGILAHLTKILNDSNANITHFSLNDEESEHNQVTFIITVRNKSHLTRVLRRISMLAEVIKVERGK